MIETDSMGCCFPHKHTQLHLLDHHGSVEKILEISLFCGLFCLTGCVLIQLPESHVGVCLSTPLTFSVFYLSVQPHVSVSQFPPWLSVSLSVRPCLHASFLLVCRHLTFITAWPWLSLLSSLLWCSITLSSWGKHWCQATVMTF